MSNSGWARKALGAAFLGAVAMSSPASAIDSGCYSADTVRAETWLKEGPEKQATLISGEANITHRPNYLTSNSDGSIGYNIEKDGDTMCVIKYMDVHTNTKNARPAWINIPANSPNDQYLTKMEATQAAKVIFGATSVVRQKDGQEYKGAQLLFVEAGKLVEDRQAGAFISNTKSGDGKGILALVSEKPLTNENFTRLADAQQRVQTASLDIAN